MGIKAFYINIIEIQAVYKASVIEHEDHSETSLLIQDFLAKTPKEDVSLHKLARRSMTVNELR